jgi:hypothetical protein
VPVLGWTEILLGFIWLTGLGMKTFSGIGLVLIGAYGLATAPQGGQYLEFNTLFFLLSVLLVLSGAGECFSLANLLPEGAKLLTRFRPSANPTKKVSAKKENTPRKTTERDKQKLLKETTLEVKAAHSELKKARLSLIKK